MWDSYAQVYFREVYWNSTDRHQLIFSSLISAHLTVGAKSDKKNENISNNVPKSAFAQAFKQGFKFWSIYTVYTLKGHLERLPIVKHSRESFDRK